MPFIGPVEFVTCVKSDKSQKNINYLLLRWLKLLVRFRHKHAGTFGEISAFQSPI